MARSAKSRTLGGALRKARQDHGLTLRELARMIRQDQGVLSRWETGERNVKPEQVARILTMLGVDDDQYDDVIALVQRADDPIWVATTPQEHRQQTMALLDAEQAATKLTEVSPLLVPGLLQTNGYTRAIMESSGLEASEVATRVAIRAKRKEVIHGSDPVRFHAVIGRLPLTNIIGNKEGMIEQLRHLRDLARLPNVVICVLPAQCGFTPASSGQFYLLDFGHGPSLVHLDGRRPVFLHEPYDVTSFQRAAEEVFAASLSAQESIELIAQLINKMEES